MVQGIIENDHIQWHPPLIRPNFWPSYWSGTFYRIWLFTWLRVVSIEHFQRVRHVNRGRFLLRTPGPVPFGTCIGSNVETIFSWYELVFFADIWVSNIPRYFCFYLVKGDTHNYNRWCLFWNILSLLYVYKWRKMYALYVIIMQNLSANLKWIGLRLVIT